MRCNFSGLWGGVPSGVPSGVGVQQSFPHNSQRAQDGLLLPAVRQRAPKPMANPEHLKLLHQGVDVWNAWKIREPITPDLRDARLTSADLRGANLQNVNL